MINAEYETAKDEREKVEAARAFASRIISITVKLKEKVDP